jgi:hypothetical protein
MPADAAGQRVALVAAATSGFLTPFMGSGQTGRCGRFGSGQSTWKNFPRGASTRS